MKDMIGFIETLEMAKRDQATPSSVGGIHRQVGWTMSAKQEGAGKEDKKLKFWACEGFGGDLGTGQGKALYHGMPRAICRGGP